jgi:hypothetical protein
MSMKDGLLAGFSSQQLFKSFVSCRRVAWRVAWSKLVVNSYRKIRINVFGYGKLKRTLGAFTCTMDDLHRGRKATLVSDFEEVMMRVVHPCREAMGVWVCFHLGLLYFYYTKPAA